ncbi:MAG: pilin [Patescibacteria group bacterium]
MHNKDQSAKKTRRKKQLFSFLFLAVFFISLSAFFLIYATPTFAEKIKIPKLNVSIPGLDFKKLPVIRTAGKIYIPWLGAYIAAVYAYLVGVSVIAAAVMIVYGGFRYILGSSMGSVTRGKEIIKDALIGLMLIFGTYTILATLNQNLVEPKSLAVESVNPVLLGRVAEVLSTTREPTYLPPVIPRAEPTPTAPEAPAVSLSTPPTMGGEVAPSFTPSSEPCPLDWAVVTTPDRSGEPKGKNGTSYAFTGHTIEFFEKIIPLLTGNTFSSRIQQAADIAVRCKAALTSCGATSGFLWTLAGVGDKECLHLGNAKEKKKLFPQWSCQPHQPNPVTLRPKDTYQSIRIMDFGDFSGLVCNNKCSQADKKSDCVATQGAAIAKARDIAMRLGGEGYPDSWSNELKPGDVLWMYSGNTECQGMHSTIFLGWENQSGKARIVQGQVNWPTTYGSVCLKSACGNWAAITNIIRPNPAKVTPPDPTPAP